jgi:uncharacterized membrane protein
MKTPGEFSKTVVLDTVVAAGGRATNAELAHRAGYSEVTIDNCLRFLEAEGRIARQKIGRRRQITVMA